MRVAVSKASRMGRGPLPYHREGGCLEGLRWVQGPTNCFMHEVVLKVANITYLAMQIVSIPTRRKTKLYSTKVDVSNVTRITRATTR